MLHQIADDAPAVLTKMAAALKPGGWLLAQEPDFHLAPTTEPDTWAAAWNGLLEWGQRNGVDWCIGRRLPGLVDGLGLERAQANTDVENIRGRDRGAVYFQLFFAEAPYRVIASGLLDAKALDAAAALLNDPAYWTQCWMMTAVWARKPPAGCGTALPGPVERRAKGVSFRASARNLGARNLHAEIPPSSE